MEDLLDHLDQHCPMPQQILVTGLEVLTNFQCQLTTNFDQSQISFPNCGVSTTTNAVLVWLTYGIMLNLIITMISQLMKRVSNPAITCKCIANNFLNIQRWS